MKFVVHYYNGNENHVTLIQTDDPKGWVVKMCGESFQINAMVQVADDLEAVYVLLSNYLEHIILTELPEGMDTTDAVRVALMVEV